MMRLCSPHRITSKGKYRAARNIEMSDPMDTGEL